MLGGEFMDIKEKIESVIEKIKKDPSIKEQFEKEQIEIPFNQLDVNMKNQ